MPHLKFFWAWKVAFKRLHSGFHIFGQHVDVGSLNSVTKGFLWWLSFSTPLATKGPYLLSVWMDSMLHTHGLAKTWLDTLLLPELEEGDSTSKTDLYTGCNYDIMMKKMDNINTTKTCKLIPYTIWFVFIYSCLTKLLLASLHNPRAWQVVCQILKILKYFQAAAFSSACSASFCAALLALWLVLWLWAPRERWYITSELKRTIRPYQQIRVLAVGEQLAIAPVICGLAGT